mmetsp:Transcript_34217/g.55360  ORF Transcript_34217/g.55360 Transcript_34217/m.55360 type:complete len:86 (-) Transcript_34217:2603-2860(-)
MELRGTNVHVCDICPGFVDTPATQALTNPKPLEMSASDAAEHIMWAITRRKHHYAFPFAMRMLSILSALVPGWLRTPIISFFHRP